ncbi:MAG TPA: hypothetical protein VGD62_13415 [Acidobacteriaceae bacterium]
MQAPSNPMFHRHLVAAYCVTWALQLGYLAYVVRKHLAGRARL